MHVTLLPCANVACILQATALKNEACSEILMPVNEFDLRENLYFVFLFILEDHLCFSGLLPSFKLRLSHCATVEIVSIYTYIDTHTHKSKQRFFYMLIYMWVAWTLCFDHESAEDYILWKFVGLCRRSTDLRVIQGQWINECLEINKRKLMQIVTALYYSKTWF